MKPWNTGLGIVKLYSVKYTLWAFISFIIVSYDLDILARYKGILKKSSGNDRTFPVTLRERVEFDVAMSQHDFMVLFESQQVALYP